MLPTNSSKAKDNGCKPTSSNCVVWQGPDLDCIGLCKGDTISDVIAKLATELCDIIEQLDLTEFDFSCLSVPSSQEPGNFNDLIQILIDRICALEGVDPSTVDTDANDCPINCIVSIASCFQFVNPQGDTVTTMQLTDYVTAIGNQICTILDDITVIQNEIDTLQTQVNDVNTPAIAVLDTEKAAISSLQYQLSTKTEPTGSTNFVTDSMRFIENSLIGTQDALGSATKLYQNILKEGLIADEAKLFGTGNMSTIPTWVDDVQEFADSLGNLWLAVHDIREAVDFIQNNCCSTGCTDIFLNFRATLTLSPGVATITVFTDGSTGFTSDWKECSPTTNIVIADALGNTTSTKVALIPLIDNPSGHPIDIIGTTIDTTEDITVTAESCFINTAVDATCEKDYVSTISATVDCPATVLTIFATSMSYQFTATAGQTYVANIYLRGLTSPVATQIIASPGVIVFNSIFGLLTETDYDFELTVTNSSAEETVCPRQLFTTLVDNCVPPINAAAIVTT